MIKYYKLLDMINRYGMGKEDFRKRVKISSGTMAKISKHEYISLEVIDRICEVFKCQPGDIIEYIEVNTGINEINNEKMVIIRKPFIDEETEKEIMTKADYDDYND